MKIREVTTRFKSGATKIRGDRNEKSYERFSVIERLRDRDGMVLGGRAAMSQRMETTMAQSGKQDDQVYVAILILFCVIAVLAILGPIGVAVALLTIVIGIIAGLGHGGGVAVAIGGAGLGALLIGPQEWLTGPAREMAEVYRI